MTDRELDALVAEKVMGWEWVKDNPKRGPSQYREQRFIERPGFTESHPDLVVPAKGNEPVAPWNEPPAYSTSIEAAWLVVEAMSKRKDFALFDIDLVPTEVHVLKWAARFTTTGQFTESAKTAPRAICLAALAALAALGEKGEKRGL